VTWGRYPASGGVGSPFHSHTTTYYHYTRPTVPFLGGQEGGAWEVLPVSVLPDSTRWNERGIPATFWNAGPGGVPHCLPHYHHGGRPGMGSLISGYICGVTLGDWWYQMEGSLWK